MDIEVLLSYGATRRGVAMARKRMGIDTVDALGAFVRGYLNELAANPRRGYGFHHYLGCAYLGDRTGAALLEAYETWQRRAFANRQHQDAPDMVMV